MNDEKWSEILDKVISKFEVLEQGKEVLRDPDGLREFVIFESPMGKLMLERVTKPKVIDRKTFGGSKYGAASGVENVYSDIEVVKTFKAYKDEGGQWAPIDDADSISNL